MYAHINDTTFAIPQHGRSELEAGIRDFASITCAFVTGTLGLVTPNYFAQRGATSNWPFSLVSSEPTVLGDVQNPTPQALFRIREIFKLTITELASLFGVSRQTVYDWQSGKGISAVRADRLEELSKAADLFADSGLSISPRTLRRKLASGKTLFDVVRDGGPAEEATRSLIQVLRREIEQRRALDARLRNRKRTPMDQADLGIPMLDEEA
jgi:transcriptional regulator with XRE-family HTH domain